MTDDVKPLSERWRDAWKKPVKVQFREVEIPERIATREGYLSAYPEQDYIIRGVDSEEYPIKKDIFNRTYELTNSVESELMKLREQVEELKIPPVYTNAFIEDTIKRAEVAESRLAKAQEIIEPYCKACDEERNYLGKPECDSCDCWFKDVKMALSSDSTLASDSESKEETP